MAISSNIYRTRDLNEPTTIEHLPHVLAMGDDKGDQFDIAVTRGSVPVSLAVGACTGWFIRLEENKKIEDCQTVILTGSVSSNVASVILPESCYITNGRFILTIFASLEGRRHAIYIGEGLIARTYTSDLVDPGKNIPDIQDLLDKLGEMESARSVAVEAASSANTAASGANASATKADTAAANANTAAGRADTAISAAESATAKANASATKADTAAAGANASATKADTAASGANASATKADTAAANANTAAGKVDASIKAAEGATNAANTAAANANGEYEKFKNATFTATRLPNSENPRLEVTEQDGHKVFDYYIPEGKQGIKGDTGDGDVSSVWGVRPDNETGDVKMPVGGRNLLRGTKDFTGSWDLWAYEVSEEKYQNLSVISSISLWGGCSQEIIITEPGDYVFSLFAKSDIIGTQLSIYLYYRNTTGDGEVTPYNMLFNIKDTEWHRYYLAFRVTKPVTIYPRGEKNSPQGNELFICGYKLERGVVPTDWTPAPEDLEGGYSADNPPPYPIANPIAIEENTDFDTLTTPGWYFISNTAIAQTLLNGPYNLIAKSAGFCLVAKVSNDVIMQLVGSWYLCEMAFSYYSYTTKERRAWKKLYTDAPLVTSVNGKTGAVNVGSLLNENGATILSIDNDSAFLGLRVKPEGTETKFLQLSYYTDSGQPFIKSGGSNISANQRLYTQSFPPPYPVSSVNTRTGAVTLDAAAVGARASNWNPEKLFNGNADFYPVDDGTNLALHGDTNNPNISMSFGIVKSSYAPFLYVASEGYSYLYASNTPPPYPVTSVNGKTGAVTLDAAAVKALPSGTKLPSFRLDGTTLYITY